MSENYLDLSSLSRENPASDAEREAHHQLLATLLSAYADGELPTETASQIDAHLLGCARCRREVGVHRALRDRMRTVGALPAAHANPAATDVGALADRIMSRVVALPPREQPGHRSISHRVASGRTASEATRRRAWIATLIACLALPPIAVPVARTLQRRGEAVPVAAAESVPLLASVVQDYRRTMSTELPGRARDLDAVRAAMPFTVEPLSMPALRLLAVWTTTLEREPAAVLAYRWNDRIVLQYVVAEDVLFRNPGVRGRLAADRRVAGTAGKQAVLAWALPAAGSVLIGDVTPDELGGLWAGVSGR